MNCGQIVDFYPIYILSQDCIFPSPWAPGYRWQGWGGGVPSVGCPCWPLDGLRPTGPSLTMMLRTNRSSLEFWMSPQKMKVPATLFSRKTLCCGASSFWCPASSGPPIFLVFPHPLLEPCMHHVDCGPLGPLTPLEWSCSTTSLQHHCLVWDFLSYSLLMHRTPSVLRFLQT